MEDGKKKTLILADNQPVTRAGMKALAAGQGCFSPDVEEAADLCTLASLLVKHENSAVVLDYTLFDCTSDRLQVLHERFPDACFLLFSDALSGEFLRRMLLESERFSVLLKDSDLQEIAACLAAVAEGKQFVCAKVAAWLQGREARSDDGVLPLTATEKEVLRAFALGKTTKEVASERFLSIYTVMTHRKNIFRKLRVNNVHEAIRYAIRAGIVNAVEYYI